MVTFAADLQKNNKKKKKRGQLTKQLLQLSLCIKIAQANIFFNC